MIEKFNDIVNNRSFEKMGSESVIQRKNFLNEVIRSHDLMGLTFGQLTFLNCNFIDINFRETNIISCNFTNCNFTETSFFKSELDNCNFKSCKIFQSDLVHAHFIGNNFTDCQFDDVNMAAVEFIRCELIEPKFHKVRFLELVQMDKSKIWKSKKCIEVNYFDDVSKIVDDLKN